MQVTSDCDMIDSGEIAAEDFQDVSMDTMSPLFRSKVDGFVPHTRHVNLRIVR